MPLPTLRPYQQRDLDRVRIAMREYRSPLLVEPTGAGKGTLASFIVHGATGKGKRCLFLVNRRILVHDMSRRLDRLGIDHGIIMGDDPRRRAWLPTHVASIDTLQRRDSAPPADLIIVDEAHFAVSPTWIKVLALYPNAKVLLMTATPIRLDGRGLEEIADVMILGPSVQELIDQGYLVPATVFAPSSAPNLAGVKKSAGDFNQKALASACDKTKLVGDIVAHWKRHASERKTAVFGVDQAHARHIQEEFNAAGIECAYVDAETSDAERDKVWNDLDNGSLRIVSSVGVISYGWDHPIVSCVVLARPTTSVALHLQQIGRGSRPAPGKTNLLVLDHAGNTHRHGLYEDPREWSLTGRALQDKDKDDGPAICTCLKCRCIFRRGPERCPFCGAAIPVQARKVEVVDGELQEFKRAQTAERWRKLDIPQRRTMYERWVALGRARGYKPTWAKVTYSRIFGVWPDHDLKQEKMEAIG